MLHLVGFFFCLCLCLLPSPFPLTYPLSCSLIEANGAAALVYVVFPIFPCESHISFLNVSIFRRSVLMKPHISAAECSASSAWNFLTHFISFPTFPSPPAVFVPFPSHPSLSLPPAFDFSSPPPSVCPTSCSSLPAAPFPPPALPRVLRPVHYCVHGAYSLLHKEWAAPPQVPGLGARARNSSYTSAVRELQQPLLGLWELGNTRNRHCPVRPSLPCRRRK